jgi:uncharacterized iron-regulated membrane protein
MSEPSVDQEGDIMVASLMGIGCLLSIVMAPFAWLTWRERVQARALRVRAEINGAVNAALGGESFVGVDIEPSMPWRAGRVVVSVPSDWSRVLEPLWIAVLARLPRRYELVMRREGTSGWSPA